MRRSNAGLFFEKIRSDCEKNTQLAAKFAAQMPHFSQATRWSYLFLSCAAAVLCAATPVDPSYDPTTRVIPQPSCSPVKFPGVTEPRGTRYEYLNSNASSLICACLCYFDIGLTHLRCFLRKCS
jgi:hypothetical protein